MICIYEVFAIISAIVRNFLIPNPFDSLRGQTIEISGIEIPIIPEVINFLIEPLLGKFTFFVVGFYYNRVERKALFGSILFLFFYCFHTFNIFIVAHLNFSALSTTLVIIFSILLYILIGIITSKFRKILYGISY